jgi:predicted ATPase
LDPSEFGFIVEIYLRDGKGRKHLFEDVGSGIGYLLPVLCAVYEQSGFESTCFIQQPELHIHPALQSAMGDVFIEGSGDNRQILIETHSEHLLLRIIKRIRQTHLQAAIAPELKIEADDVCVLYFDPSPDGTTTVKRLRTTEDGDFMDRWPRGFFGERDQELLDE